MQKVTVFLHLWKWPFVVAFALVADVGFSQTIDSARINHIGGGATITNNGISLIPTFSLNKPAAIFDLSVGNRRLAFEPQFRFALNKARPWSFILWWRYKLVNKQRFTLGIGAHPSMIFRTVMTDVNGVPTETTVVQRFFATEIVPNYYLTKDITVGMYYLHGINLDNEAPKSSDFVTVNANFTNLKLTKQFYMKFNPQVYYLRLDSDDGFYFTSTIGLLKRDFPLSIQSIINKAIDTRIPSKDFVWNVSLVYWFNKEFK